MKKYLLIILFFSCFTLKSDAQHEWASIGTKWYYDYNQNTSVGYVKIEYIEDTIISNDTCKVLKKTRYTFDYPGVYNTVFLGNEYLFQSGNKIYNYKYGQFYLLYDFSSNIGDIWTVSATSRYQYSNCDTIGKVYVDSIGEKIINLDTFKIIFTSPYQNSDWIYTGPIIEKIGCYGYMFPQQYLCDIDHNEGGNLRCYSDNEIMHDEHFFKIFPNPTNDNVNIHLFPQGINILHQIEIYNCFGQLIRKIIVDDSIKYSDYNFNIHSLSTGIYLIKINTSYGFFERKIIKN